MTPIRLERFSRVTLLEGSTPIQRLKRLEEALGGNIAVPRIYVKRDDLTGLGGGGSKLRKLEFLLGEALDNGCDTFITTGGRQSNHARLSAGAAARVGMGCELVLADIVPRDDQAYRWNGNVFLDHLLGAKVHHLPGDTDPLAFAQERVVEIGRRGGKAYLVGSGGSSPIGCLGYAACAAEIVRQEGEIGVRFRHIVVPNGSSGTHAGLAAGLAALGDEPSRVRSYTVFAPLEAARSTTGRLATQTLTLLDIDQSDALNEIDVVGGQLGDGYGIPTDAMLEAVRLIARSEGLLVDPVYGGKALAGLLAAVRAGEYGRDDAVLFIMTGGTPGLFAYESAFAANPIQD